MKSLNEDIKNGQWKPVYLLYGEEAYLKKQYKDRMTKAILPGWRYRQLRLLRRKRNQSGRAY